MRRGSGGRPFGPEFVRLLSASAVSNVGDGIRLAAGPLLVASLTDDPALVGAAIFVQKLPWLLLSLPAGAYVDRLDRRRVIQAVNLIRALVAGMLALAVAGGMATIPLLCAVLFAVGLAEVIVDNAASALVPAVVAPEHLARANARLTMAFFVGDQLTGPALAAWLFAAGTALPFAVEAASFVLAALLLAEARGWPEPRPVRPRHSGWLRRDVAEGVRFLWHHHGVRLLAVVLGVMKRDLHDGVRRLGPVRQGATGTVGDRLWAAAERHRRGQARGCHAHRTAHGPVRRGHAAAGWAAHGDRGPRRPGPDNRPVGGRRDHGALRRPRRGVGRRPRHRAPATRAGRVAGAGETACTS